MANDKLKVIAEIIPGGSGFYVVNSDNVGVGDQSLTAALQAGGAETNKKADKTYVDTELGKKSDKTYVDEELAKKSDKTYVDEELAKKADTTTVTALETTVSGKADNSTVSTLQTQVNTNTTKTVDLQSQIDTLVIESGGDSNPEVVQARTDENGVAHTTLKDRIDSSFTELKSDLIQLKKYTGYDVKLVFNHTTGNADTEMYVNAGETYHIVNNNNYNLIMFVLDHSDYAVTIQHNSSADFSPVYSGYVRFYSSAKPSETLYVTVEIGLSKKISELENKIVVEETDVNYLKNRKRKIVLPKYNNAPTPIDEIFYDGVEYTMNTGFVMPTRTIYVKPTRSGATGDGSASSPYKSFATAFDDAISNGSTKIVILPTTNDISLIGYFGNITSEKTLSNINIAIVPAENCKRIVMSNHWEESTYTLSDGLYKNNNATAWNGAYDINYRDEYGTIIPYVKTASKNECKSKKGSFYIDDREIYVNPVTSIDTVYCTLNGNIYSFVLNNGAKLYFKDTDFINPTTRLNSMGSTPCLHTITSTFSNTGTLICENCNASGAIRNNGKTDGGFGFHVHRNGAIMINCKSAYNTDDGFDYMHTNQMTLSEIANSQVIELNCIGYENGNSERTGIETNIANASTTHNMTNIIRCGCVGYNCSGPVFADVGSAKVINYDCTARNSLSNTNGHGFLIQTDNEFDTDGVMYCINCTADGNLVSSISVGESTEKAYAYVSNMTSFIAPIINGESELITFGSLI